MAADYTKNLKPDGVFTVGESRGLMLALAGIFAALFIYDLIDLVLHPETAITNHLLLLAALPAFICLRKARDKSVIMRIDRTGFVYYGKRLFTWEQFISAKVEEVKAQNVRFGDNFQLVLQYYREDGNIYGRNVALTNTQNKAEEEIIAAIRYYERLYQEGGA
ncbi:MAG: hypothetical protein EOO15_05660 [Chitinophagaceae bacterium]|nr:MAG: hypothetical protein EOO15_05660 [Chitinophagaceae bacterium]